MHHTVQAILREDKKYQAKKNLLEQESAKKVQDLRQQLEKELVKLKSSLKHKSSLAGLTTSEPQNLTDNFEKEIALHKDRILKIFQDQKRAVSARITEIHAKEK